MNIERPKSEQPIPPNAKKVFTGVLFDVYQWEQELFDGKKTTFEKAGKQDSVILFPILDDGKILLADQEQPGRKPFISSIGGEINKGEDVLTAAKRELLEESGYEASEFILWSAYHSSGKIDWVIYTFIVKGLKKVGGLQLDGGEKIKLITVTFDEFTEMADDDEFSERDVRFKLMEAKANQEKKKELKKLFC